MIVPCKKCNKEPCTCPVWGVVYPQNGIGMWWSRSDKRVDKIYPEDIPHILNELDEAKEVIKNLAASLEGDVNTLKYTLQTRLGYYD